MIVVGRLAVHTLHTPGGSVGGNVGGRLCGSVGGSVGGRLCGSVGGGVSGSGSGGGKRTGGLSSCGEPAAAGVLPPQVLVVLIE